MFSIGDLIQRYMQGQFNNHPAMKQINNMLAGKTPEQQMAGVVRYPTEFAYNAGQSPFCNNGCGCGF